MFSVNGNGQVRVPQQGLDFNDSPFYNLLIVAENVDDSCQRSRFRLSVRVGRNYITFPALVPVSVFEMATVGTEVTVISATGGAGQIRYSLIGSSSPFEIDGTSGRIVVDDVLDFETEMQYSVMIEAESVGTIVSGSVTQVINIMDVNEQPDWTTVCAMKGECTAEVEENLSPLAVGDTLNVMDPDLPSLANGQISYRIVSSDAQLPFSVNSVGQVHTTKPLDREDRETYGFIVIAADGGSPSLSVSTTFRVMVTDVNDESPVFVQGPESIPVPENEPINTVIAQYIATDGDTPQNAQIVYSLSPSTGIPFELNPDNGALSITELIDYENPNTREFSITVTANNSPLSSTVTTLIEITDVNDNEPVFDRDSYDFDVPEHSGDDTPVGTVVATDADSGANGEVCYSITAGDSQGYFSIDAATGAIVVSADIDRELVGSVELTVRAKDKGTSPLFSTAPITITITDINDNAPVFNPDLYTASLREDKPVDSLAFIVFATDADKPGTNNSRIVYSITSGNEGDAFRIDAASGVVEINNNPLNHEEISSYTLTIKAEDRGSPPLSDTATAEVMVINVNEAPPTLSGDQEIFTSEATPTGVIVASFTASDADFTPVSISIASGNEEGRFQIDPEGHISIVVMLDFETTQNYTLAIEASDGEESDLASLFVTVVDDNEFPPEFSGDNFFTLDEELQSGTPVGIITATDGDGSAPNNEITYSFSSPSSIQEYFVLDQSTGEITTAAVLDREMLSGVFPLPSSSMSVQVFARDGGSPSRQSSRMYTITLLDINDNNPQFENNGYSDSILENQPAQSVLSFTATDRDLAENAEIHFSFTVDPVEGGPLFELADDRIGEISTTQALDCEVQASYSFTLTATDRGNPRRNSSVPATLTLRDVNDNSPVFTEDPYYFTVAETAVVDSVVGEVQANDSDKGANGEVFYEIVGQDELEEVGESVGGGRPFFVIDEYTGEIRHLTEFDFESFPSVDITVKATDKGTPRQSSITQVVFTVTNVDESAPRFGSSCDDVILSENTPVDSIIVNCMATDVDNTTTADDDQWITYTFLSGNNDGTFSIGLNDGIIRNTMELDFETNSFFRLGIRATDGSGRGRVRFINIIVEDENDNAPSFQSRSFSFAMTSDEIESNTQMVARARATDGDSGSNGEVYHSIEEDGVERVSETETRVTITARDRGDVPQTSTATLTVVFEEECLLQRYMVDSASGDVMAQVLCSVEIVPVSTDVVLGTDHTAYCRVVRNSLASYQWILNGSAIDLAAFLSDEDRAATLNVAGVGYQDAGSYACKVTTDAGSLQTSTYTVNILGMPHKPLCIYPPSYIISLYSPCTVVPIITVVPRPVAVPPNSPVEFSCFAVGTPAPSIHWEYEGRTVGTGNTLTIGNYQWHSCMHIYSV